MLLNMIEGFIHVGLLHLAKNAAMLDVTPKSSSQHKHNTTHINTNNTTERDNPQNKQQETRNTKINETLFP